MADRLKSKAEKSMRLENAVLKACKLSPKFRVADVGAGTGLFTRLFAKELENGWVFAVDISPQFLKHVESSSEQQGLRNVSPVLGSEDTVNLPPESVDLVFICDTYHHFEYPQATMESIHQALKPGGHLVLIDFERIPGVSREWLLNHVRAGKDVFRQEIEGVGFAFVEQVPVEGLKENYFIRFQKR